MILFGEDKNELIVVTSRRRRYNKKWWWSSRRGRYDAAASNATTTPSPPPVRHGDSIPTRLCLKNDDFFSPRFKSPSEKAFKPDRCEGGWLWLKKTDNTSKRRRFIFSFHEAKVPTWDRVRYRIHPSIVPPYHIGPLKRRSCGTVDASDRFKYFKIPAFDLRVFNGNMANAAPHNSATRYNVNETTSSLII